MSFTLCLSLPSARFAKVPLIQSLLCCASFCKSCFLFQMLLPSFLRSFTSVSQSPSCSHVFSVSSLWFLFSFLSSLSFLWSILFICSSVLPHSFVLPSLFPPVLFFSSSFVPHFLRSSAHLVQKHLTFVDCGVRRESFFFCGFEHLFCGLSCRCLERNIFACSFEDSSLLKCFANKSFGACQPSADASAANAMSDRTWLWGVLL